MSTSYWGPEYDDKSISAILRKTDLRYEMFNEERVIKKCAEAIAEGNVIGWFQGRAEYRNRAGRPQAPEHHGGQLPHRPARA